MACSFCGRESERSVCERCAGILRGINRGPLQCGLEARVGPQAPSKTERDDAGTGTKSWAPEVFGPSGAESIYAGCERRRWSLVHFENLVSYGSADNYRNLLRSAGYRHNIPQDDSVLDITTGEAVCGVTANRLARLFLGAQAGGQLAAQLNAYIRRGEAAPRVEGVTCGAGVRALGAALGEHRHAIVLVHAGENHRFILERRPDDTVVILQGWFEAYTLAEWMDARNRAKTTRTVNAFMELLDQAVSAGDLQQRRTANAQLFHPAQRNDIQDILDRNVAITFALRDVGAREVPGNVDAWFEHPNDLD